MNKIKCAAKCQRDDTAVSQSLIVNKGPGVSDKNPIDYKHLRSYFMFVFKKSYEQFSHQVYSNVWKTFFPIMTYLWTSSCQCSDGPIKLQSQS